MFVAFNTYYNFIQVVFHCVYFDRVGRGKWKLSFFLVQYLKGLEQGKGQDRDRKRDRDNLVEGLSYG